MTLWQWLLLLLGLAIAVVIAFVVPSLVRYLTMKRM